VLNREGTTTMGTTTTNVPGPPKDDKKLDELRGIRLELASFRKVFEDFAVAYLDAKFPHGRATDRFGEKRRG
jgi:hypothetical protein